MNGPTTNYNCKKCGQVAFVKVTKFLGLRTYYLCYQHSIGDTA